LESVEIRSGPAKVVASGTVIAFGKNPVEIRFGPTGKSLTLRIRFADEEHGGAPRSEGVVDPSGTLNLTLYGFTSPLGTGNTEPLQVGWWAGLELYLSYRVYDIGGGADKTVQFTLYQREVGGRQ
jgi:hypothetical protein